MDYKLTLTTAQLDAAGLRDLAATILGDHGEAFDAKLGDFSTSAEDGRVVVFVKDVAQGDIAMLADDLHERYGDGLVIAASRFEHGNWWPVDLDGDDD
jgi:hypothetical protein